MDEVTNTIKIMRFNKPAEIIEGLSEEERGHNHGGGDNRLMGEFYRVLCGEEDAPTRLEDSIESHLMAIRAEESRKKGGEMLRVHRKID